jgi:hypothetical protein
MRHTLLHESSKEGVESMDEPKTTNGSETNDAAKPPTTKSKNEQLAEQLSKLYEQELSSDSYRETMREKRLARELIYNRSA